MRVSRFERRIVVAMVGVAFVTVLAALVLGYIAVAEAYKVGMNDQVRGLLDRSIELYAEDIALQRETGKRAADAIAFDYRVHDAASRRDADALRRLFSISMRRYPNVARIRYLDRDHVEIVSVEDPDRLDPVEYHAVFVKPRTNLGVVEVTIVLDRAFENEFLRAGETTEVYRHFVDEPETIYRWFIGTYLALLLGFVAIALAVGIIFARRVTRGVALLAEATQKVGRGDLSVTVPTDERDEIAELTRSFNAMVRDIRDGRDRIEYLQRIAAWQEFARRLAHEIKNPLTPIQLAVQEIHRTYKGDDPRYKRTVDDAAAIVEEEITTLRRLVSEFSEFARLPVAALEDADLGAFTREALRGLDVAALMLSEDGTPPALSLDVADAKMPVRIDAQMLRRVLDNLVRNAVHAVVASAPEGGGAIVVAARLEGENVVLEVRDNGPGIEPELRARVFDPYYTTKGEGTGLGLAIVKKVVLEHGGSIECGEAPEGGAAFCLRLPARAP